MKDQDLAKAGLPYNLWHCENPGIEPLDATEIYLAGNNVVMMPDMKSRVQSMVWLAQDIGDQMNRYYRLPDEHKRKEPTPLLVDGTEISFPFTVKMIGVWDLVELFKATSKDDDRNFDDEVCKPDFYFLLDLGDELEYPNTFGAKVVREFFQARGQETLPVVVSLAKAPSKVMDKHGEHVYEEFKELLQGAVRVRLA
jgi:hypothetical protein